MNPLAIDLYCGLGGWTDGLLAEGWDVIGVDIEEHVYGEHRYPGWLLIQDVLTLHGSQFRGVDLIVGSSPCQEFSYRAMPWKRAKALGAPELGIKLFEAQFRIQREACEAAGRHIPLVVENVRGAQKWVGRARWNFGSFYLWGDVPALMPPVSARKLQGFRFDGSGRSFQSASVEQSGVKVGDAGWRDTGPGRQLQDRAIKNRGQDWNRFRETGEVSPHWNVSATKQPGISGPRDNGKGDRWFQDGAARHGSKSKARKAASAMIAKIPLPLARHIGATFHPTKRSMT